MNSKAQSKNITSNVTPIRKPVKCPNCAKQSVRDTYPFCSKRCADLDLGRWFNGLYQIAEPDGLDNSQ